jgi:hypothetical protein
MSALSPKDIRAAITKIEERRKTNPEMGIGYEHELLALRDLLSSFIDATEGAGREAMQWMSIDQVRILNQLYLAAGR